MCNRTFPHFYWATKYAIAHPHIFKERQNVGLHICTFSKSENVRCVNVQLPNPEELELNLMLQFLKATVSRHFWPLFCLFFIPISSDCWDKTFFQKFKFTKIVIYKILNCNKFILPLLTAKLFAFSCFILA